MKAAKTCIHPENTLSPLFRAQLGEARSAREVSLVFSRQMTVFMDMVYQGAVVFHDGTRIRTRKRRTGTG